MNQRLKIIFLLTSAKLVVYIYSKSVLGAVAALFSQRGELQHTEEPGRAKTQIEGQRSNQPVSIWGFRGAVRTVIF